MFLLWSPMFSKLWSYDVSFGVRKRSLWNQACSYEIYVNVLMMLWEWSINDDVLLLKELLIYTVCMIVKDFSHNKGS